MADAYLQIIVFALIAVFVPLFLLLFSKLVRLRGNGNEVQTLVYESAEESVGQRVEIMHEYLHYFAIFLAFEIIAIMVIIWSTFSGQVRNASFSYILALLSFAVVFELLVFGIIKSKGE